MSTQDITKNYHKGNQYSKEAHNSIRNDAAHLRSQILRYIESQGQRGATCDETEAALHMSHQTASARFTELKADESIKQIGERPTRTGRKAAVFAVRESEVTTEAPPSSLFEDAAPSKYAMGL
jgi:Fic family protein